MAKLSNPNPDIDASQADPEALSEDVDDFIKAANRCIQIPRKAKASVHRTPLSPLKHNMCFVNIRLSSLSRSEARNLGRPYMEPGPASDIDGVLRLAFVQLRRMAEIVRKGDLAFENFVEVGRR